MQIKKRWASATSAKTNASLARANWLAPAVHELCCQETSDA